MAGEHGLHLLAGLQHGDADGGRRCHEVGIERVEVGPGEAGALAVELQPGAGG
jgi:hypothetical protein